MSSKEESDIRTSVDPKYATCIVSNVHFCTSVGVGGGPVMLEECGILTREVS